MIRSGHIPLVLNRIIWDTNDPLQPQQPPSQIVAALLVTYDGELLGTSTSTTGTTGSAALQAKDPESLGTLLADIAMEYHRLGQDFQRGKQHHHNHKTSNNTSSTSTTSGNNSKMDCVLLQFEGGIAAAVPCPTMECLVVAIAQSTTPLGVLRAKLHALAHHIQESMSLLLMETTTTTTTTTNNPSTTTSTGTTTTSSTNTVVQQH
jgi:hypothetical protein